MNILFLSIGRLNSINESGLYPDLLRKFRDEGHNIYVVSPVERRQKKETQIVNEDRVHFLKVKTLNITKTNIVEKGLSTILLEYQFLKAIKKYYKKVHFDLVLYTTPPITFAKVVNYIKKKYRAKSYLLLKDIFPQNAIDLNMMNKKGIIYKFFKYKEKKLYEQSDYIGCMSKANVEFVLKNNQTIPNEKVEVCPNSIEPKELINDKFSRNNIRKKYNIPLDKTVFVYGGNLGKPQGITFLMECLDECRNLEDVFFIIAGSGTEYNKLNNYLARENLSNAMLLPRIPKADYELLVNSCDVGLIFLDYRFTIPNFPSRLLSYMEASMPVLAATDNNTDVGEVIEEGKFGFWCESNNKEDFKGKIKSLCDKNMRLNMGSNARKYLMNNYTVDNSYEIIMNHFKKEKRTINV